MSTTLNGRQIITHSNDALHSIHFRFNRRWCGTVCVYCVSWEISWNEVDVDEFVLVFFLSNFRFQLKFPIMNERMSMLYQVGVRIIMDMDMDMWQCGIGFEASIGTFNIASAFRSSLMNGEQIDFAQTIFNFVINSRYWITSLILYIVFGDPLWHAIRAKRTRHLNFITKVCANEWWDQTCAYAVPTVLQWNTTQMKRHSKLIKRSNLVDARCGRNAMK